MQAFVLWYKVHHNHLPGVMYKFHVTIRRPQDRGKSSHPSHPLLVPASNNEVLILPLPLLWRHLSPAAGSLLSGPSKLVNLVSSEEVLLLPFLTWNMQDIYKAAGCILQLPGIQEHKGLSFPSPGKGEEDIDRKTCSYIINLSFGP